MADSDFNFEELRGLRNSANFAIDGLTQTLQSFSSSIRSIVDSYTFHFAQLARSLSESMRPFRAIRVLAENQYVYWSFFTAEFLDEILETNNINRTLREINVKTKYSETEQIIKTIINDQRVSQNQKIFAQAVTAFHHGNVDLSLLGLLAVTDGLLSLISHNNTTSIFKRADAILGKIEDDDDIDNEEYGILALTYTFRKTMETLSANSSFDKKEPKGLNRHWIMHGRSCRKKTKLDCVKIIRFIYAILLIDDLSKSEAERSK